VEGAEKEIIWADPTAKAQTDIALIYIHGFSATKHETRPVTDKIADVLGANIYYARLKGHGRDGDAMAEASFQDWANDYAEAIAIGEKLGKKLIILSASTGSTLATWGLTNPELSKNVSGIVMISPAIFPMTSMLKVLKSVDKSKIMTPAFFIYAPEDKVIVSQEVEKVASEWGGPTKILKIEETSDPYKHVIAGDILSPENTNRVTYEIIAWLVQNKKLNLPEIFRGSDNAF